MKIGYYPRPLDFATPRGIRLATLPDLSTIVVQIESSQHVFNGWAVVPLSSRVFGLPYTHDLTYSSADNDDHIPLPRVVSWVFPRHAYDRLGGRIPRRSST
jgi:hypothetical protein